MKKFVSEFKKFLNNYFNKNDNKIARDVARDIGYFYYDKYQHEGKEKVYYYVDMLGITSIEYSNGIVTITLKRPGILIGKKGENIDSLKEYLNKNNVVETINIKENKIDMDLHAFHWMYDDMSCDEM